MTVHPARPEPVGSAAAGRYAQGRLRGELRPRRGVEGRTTAVALAFALALAACGVKGPPRPPGAKDPAADGAAPAARAGAPAAAAACGQGCGAGAAAAPEPRKP